MRLAGARIGLNTGLGVLTGSLASGSTGLCGVRELVGGRLARAFSSSCTGTVTAQRGWKFESPAIRRFLNGYLRAAGI